VLRQRVLGFPHALQLLLSAALRRRHSGAGEAHEPHALGQRHAIHKRLTHGVRQRPIIVVLVLRRRQSALQRLVFGVFLIRNHHLSKKSKQMNERTRTHARMSDSAKRKHQKERKEGLTSCGQGQVIVSGSFGQPLT
jgi:hypothetical protein